MIPISISHYYTRNPLIINKIQNKKYVIKKRMLYSIVPNEKKVIKQSIIILHKRIRNEKG